MNASKAVGFIFLFLVIIAWGVAGFIFLPVAILDLIHAGPNFWNLFWITLFGYGLAAGVATAAKK